jgi:streptogramin lyase
MRWSNAVELRAAGLIVGALLLSSQLALAQIITEFPVPAVQSDTSGITTGPDGALWFTDARCQQHRADHDRRCDYRIPYSYAQ